MITLHEYSAWVAYSLPARLLFKQLCAPLSGSRGSRSFTAEENGKSAIAVYTVLRDNLQNAGDFLHSWIIKMATPQEAFDDAVKALTKLEDKEFDGKVISLSKTDKNRLFVQCYCFSKIQWLDVVEISFHESGNGTTLAKVTLLHPSDGC